MGASKTELFIEKDVELAAMAKAIAHPARIAILRKLIKMDTCVCGDLVEELGLAQPTISQHLKELKNVGLIRGTVEGVRVCYCINTTVWQQYKVLFAGFFVDVKLNSCC